MAFRDDLDAAHARNRALEVQVANLERENAALRGEVSLTTSPVPALDRPQPSVRWSAFALVLLGGAAMVIAASLASPLAAALTGVFVLGGVGALAMLRVALRYAPAGHILVVHGRPRRLPSGEMVHCRVVPSGIRTMCIPALESVQTLDVTPKTVDLAVDRVFDRSAQSISFRGSLTARLADAEPRVHDAIEFLGSEDQVVAVAAQVVEGQIRQRVADLDTESIRADLAEFNRQVLVESIRDLDRTGIEIDHLALAPRDP